MGKNLSYTAVGLDRVHHRRRDNAWIAGRLADEKTRIVPVWRDRSLISPGAATIEGTPGDTPKAVLLGGRPLRESFVQKGPFAMRDADQLEAVIAAHAAGKLGAIY